MYKIMHVSDEFQILNTIYTVYIIYIYIYERMVI